MRTTPRVCLALSAALLIPGAAPAQKFTDCGMGNVTLLLPDQKPPKGPGCGTMDALITGPLAHSLVDSAIRAAEANAKTVSAEGADADAAISAPYGAEKLSEGASAVVRVKEKETLWKAVHEILLAERQKVRALKDDDKEGESAADAAGLKTHALNSLATSINAADAILKDVAADKARLKAVAAKEKSAETEASVLKRKTALFAKLAPPKKKE